MAFLVTWGEIHIVRSEKRIREDWLPFFSLQQYVFKDYSLICKNRKWKRVLKATVKVFSKINPPRAPDKSLKV